MKWYWYVISICCTGLLFGCKGAQTQSESSGSITSALHLSNQSIYYIAAYNSPLTINGTCDEFTDSIQLSVDSSFASNLTVGNCSNKIFTASNIDFSENGFLGAAAGFLSTDDSNTPIKIFYLRGNGLLGPTAVATFSVQINSATQNRIADISSGGGKVVGSSYAIQSKIGAPHSARQVAGVKYKIHLNGGQ